MAFNSSKPNVRGSNDRIKKRFSALLGGGCAVWAGWRNGGRLPRAGGQRRRDGEEVLLAEAVRAQQEWRRKRRKDEQNGLCRGHVEKALSGQQALRGDMQACLTSSCKPTGRAEREAASQKERGRDRGAQCVRVGTWDGRQEGTLAQVTGQETWLKQWQSGWALCEGRWQ